MDLFEQLYANAPSDNFFGRVEQSSGSESVLPDIATHGSGDLSTQAGPENNSTIGRTVGDLATGEATRVPADAIAPDGAPITHNVDGGYDPYMALDTLSQTDDVLADVATSIVQLLE
jgi:hypothetical protein